MLPTDPHRLDEFIAASRKLIEPWLSAVVQADHLNLLLGSGFTTAIASVAGATATAMAPVKLRTRYAPAIDAHAEAAAKAMNRGKPNIEDQVRSALAVLEGLAVTNPAKAATLKRAIDKEISRFLTSLLALLRGFDLA